MYRLSSRRALGVWRVVVVVVVVDGCEMPRGQVCMMLFENLFQKQCILTVFLWFCYITFQKPCVLPVFPIFFMLNVLNMLCFTSLSNLLRFSRTIAAKPTENQKKIKVLKVSKNCLLQICPSFSNKINQKRKERRVKHRVF